MPRSKLSRRRFLALVAAGSAASASAAVAADSTPRTKKKAASAVPAKPAKTPVYAAPPAPNAEIARGIAQQKEWLASSLETLRKFELPPGSEQAFAFRPLESKRRKT